MGKLQKNQKGFTAVEGLLIVLILVVIGAVGYMVYHNDHKTKTVSTTTTSTNKPVTTTKTSTTTTQAPNPYAGWDSYTLKQEGITFKYPSTWTLKDMSDSNDDFELLTGTNNFQMTIGAGAAVSAVNAPYGGDTVVQADPITFAGQSAYMDLWTDEGSGSSSIYSIWLSQSSTQAGDFFPSKNISFNASNSSVVVLMDYNAPNATHFTNEPLSYVESDTNYKDAKLIVSSMTY